MTCSWWMLMAWGSDPLTWCSIRSAHTLKPQLHHNWLTFKLTQNLGPLSTPFDTGLLNATFGNAVEMIISVFALREGLTEADVEFWADVFRQVLRWWPPVLKICSIWRSWDNSTFCFINCFSFYAWVHVNIMLGSCPIAPRWWREAWWGVSFRICCWCLDTRLQVCTLS